MSSNEQKKEGDKNVRIKWSHRGVFRRFEVPLQDGYSVLLQKIVAVVPDFSEQLIWKDEEGDSIVLSSNDDFAHAVSLISNQELLRLFTNETSANSAPNAASPDNEEPRVKEVHNGVICDVCDNQIVGIRYKCSVCPDFDLCENCEKKAFHADHAMIRYVSSKTWPFFRYHYPHRRFHRGCKGPFSNDVFDSNNAYQKLTCAARDAALQAHRDVAGIGAIATEAMLTAAAHVASNLNGGKTEDVSSKSSVNLEQNKKDGNSKPEKVTLQDAIVQKLDDSLREVGVQVQRALSGLGVEVPEFKIHKETVDESPKSKEDENSSEHSTDQENFADKREAEKRRNDDLNSKESTEQVDSVTVPLKKMNISDTGSSGKDVPLIDLERSLTVNQDNSSGNQNVTTITEKENELKSSSVIKESNGTSLSPTMVESEFVADEDSGIEGWTVMGVHNAPPENPNIYPTLLESSEECRAGTPFVTPRPGPHNRHCFFIHQDPHIAQCVQRIEDMGFDNCNGWVTKFAVMLNGDVSRVIDALPSDKVYASHLKK